MTIVNRDMVISCEVDGKENIYFVRLDLIKEGEQISTLEFADITQDFQDLMEANTYFSLYDSPEGLKEDLAKAHLSKFLHEERVSDNLDVLLNLVTKMRHSQGQCKDSCIYCNPDLGDDPLPDFTFEAKRYDAKGET